MAKINREPAKKSATNFKIWTASRSAKAGFMVTERSVLMAGDKTNFIAADNKGVYISGGGSVAFGTGRENLRTGGLFIGMNDFINLIPQTIVTPIPNEIPFPPISLPVGLAKELPNFLAFTLVAGL